MKCLKCQQDLNGKYQKKFCNNSCAAKFNNTARAKHKTVSCYICNAEFIITEKEKRRRCFACPPPIKKTKIDLKKNNTFDCKVCGKNFKRRNSQLYCGESCKQQVTRKRYKKICLHCKSDFLGEKENSKFCSRSCRSLSLKLHTYAHKKSGLSRSKIEHSIEESLNKDFPHLNIVFNDKNTLGLELDIFIPNLKLAFELNGIFHYKPVYGTETLNKIQNRDKHKTLLCHSLGLKLITIPLGNTRFTEKHKQDVYKQIKKIINENGGPSR